MIVSIIFIIWYGTMWFFGFLGLYISLTRYAKSAIPSPLEIASKDKVEGVTILRPLRGLDCNLYENLESSFLQKYPKFEIIFSVAEETDAAIPIVKELMKKYPLVDATLLIGEEIVGVNPKINNLIRSYRLAAYDILWIVDSNVLSALGTCARSVTLLTTSPKSGKKEIGLIHHLPFAILPADELGARVEQVFLCSTHPKMYLAINELAIASCVAGKSTLFRKTNLERAAILKRQSGKGMKLSGGEGGLAAFGKYLGEDNMIGEAIWIELGMRHAMGVDLAGNTVGNMNFGTYFRRRVRWIRVRKFMVIASTIVEPLTECFVLSIIGSYLFYSILSPFLFVPLHIIAWFSLDITIFNALANASPSSARRPRHDGPGLDYFYAWCVRELMALPIWTFAMMGYTVGWRDDGETYQVLMNGSVKLARKDESDGVAEWIFQRVTTVVIKMRKGIEVVQLDPPPEKTKQLKI